LTPKVKTELPATDGAARSRYPVTGRRTERFSARVCWRAAGGEIEFIFRDQDCLAFAEGEIRFDIVEVLLTDREGRELGPLPNTFAMGKPYRYG
jgi:hypothetical protein